MIQPARRRSVVQRQRDGAERLRDATFTTKTIKAIVPDKGLFFERYVMGCTKRGVQTFMFVQKQVTR